MFESRRPSLAIALALALPVVGAVVSTAWGSVALSRGLDALAPVPSSGTVALRPGRHGVYTRAADRAPRCELRAPDGTNLALRSVAPGEHRFGDRAAFKALEFTVPAAGDYDLACATSVGLTIGPAIDQRLRPTVIPAALGLALSTLVALAWLGLRRVRGRAGSGRSRSSSRLLDLA